MVANSQRQSERTARSAANQTLMTMLNDDFAGTPGGQATPLTTVRPL